MMPLSSYANACHSPLQTIGLPTTQSDITVVPNMYSWIAAGVTSACHTAPLDALMFVDTWAVSPLFIGIPRPAWIAVVVLTRRSQSSGAQQAESCLLSLSPRDPDDVMDVRRVLELAQQKMGDIGATDGRQSGSVRQVLVLCAIVAGERPVGQPGRTRDRPVQAARHDDALHLGGVFRHVLQQRPP